MKKYFLFIFLLVSPNILAWEEPPEVYNPALAVEQALQEPLILVGKGLLSSSGRIESCLYKNSKVLVLDRYCTKEVIPAAQVTIFSPRLGFVILYASTTLKDTLVSSIRREQYMESRWWISFSDLIKVNLEMSWDEFNLVYDAYERAQHRSYCLYSEERRICTGILEPQSQPWNIWVGKFWRDPPESWYMLLSTLEVQK